MYNRTGRSPRNYPVHFPGKWREGYSIAPVYDDLQGGGESPCEGCVYERRLQEGIY